jgi:ribonuclease HII
MGICGIDEAGRGPLAGPVVAAAVILPQPQNGKWRRPKGLDDSKQLTSEQREELAVKIRAIGIVGLGVASVEEIDAINILRASHLAMQRAFEHLARQQTPVAAIVDGNMAPELPCPVECVIDGDVIVPIVSAASIIAKVERDRMMVEFCARYPGYAFSKHKGYGTPEHQAALATLGPCAIHRRSFKPVQEALAKFAELKAAS